MKKIFITLCSVFILLSCHGDDDFTSTGNPFITNQAPVAPSLVFPTNNLSCTNFNLELDWTTVLDPDKDAVEYIIDITTSSNFSVVLFTKTTSQTKHNFTLEKGMNYFWRVKARDTKGNESDYSNTQTFYTEPEAGVNSVPSVPAVISPALGDTISGSMVNLDWNTTDADGDALVFDVYFGDVNPPPLFAQNRSTSALNVSIFANKIYYWRVVAKDDKQGVAIGQVWNFSTP